MDSRLARIRSRSLFGNPRLGQLNGLHFQAWLTGALETEKKATTASDEHVSVFTGEVGGKTVAELGGRYAEVGHAEHRRIFGEDVTVIRLKDGRRLPQRPHAHPVRGRASRRFAGRGCRAMLRGN
ncbi:triose-phosphate isomerase [Pseudarthrobacter sp. AL07]|uniref:triose-phosphate isomerase n=1 Tax=unclassified Pseudarthrobacter TaxID=2647000 RepID=UPI00249A68AD|nr:MULTISPECIES: triose-phosphate isomerase [unclassified Pseudarthrobacter]MDI3195010.1 triose-phosphate isomerase [Pseudarthrobacter sp. AL20]MDI3209118.1 triose-phosphate isomerase [Pseudarthrobacter sp. AL07]